MSYDIWVITQFQNLGQYRESECHLRQIEVFGRKGGNLGMEEERQNLSSDIVMVSILVAGFHSEGRKG